MARKDLLKGLMTPPETKEAGTGPVSNPRPEPTPAPGARPRYSRGAIGAVGQSIAELKSRALVEVPADMIDPAGLSDRLDADSEGHAALVASIRDYGQQVPVLLRHDPNVEGRYQVVYGRRRVAALRELKQPVRAMVRTLSDRELIVAQGQENTARKDLSFIEKANFARAMRDGGFERRVICDALHIDKTVISRMLTVADGLGEEMIRLIGAAPSVGRDRWLALVEAVARQGATAERVETILAEAGAGGSDARFEAVLAALTAKPARKPTASVPPRPLTDRDGAPLGKLSRSGRAAVLRLEGAEAAEFADWLAEALPDLHADWRARKG